MSRTIGFHETLVMLGSSRSHRKDRVERHLIAPQRQTGIMRSGAAVISERWSLSSERRTVRIRGAPRRLKTRGARQAERARVWQVWSEDLVDYNVASN